MLTFKGGKGESGSTVSNADDNLFSTDIVEAIFGISEGPIKGLAEGPKSFLIGNTPLENTNDKPNFDEFELIVRKGYDPGTGIRSRLGGFGQSTTVSTPLASQIPVVRTGGEPNIDYLDIRLVISRLYEETEEGARDAEVKIMIEYKAVSDNTWKNARAANSGGAIIDDDGWSWWNFGRVDLITPSPGDRVTFWEPSTPSYGGERAIWFKTDESNKPYFNFGGNDWVTRDTLVSDGPNKWKWEEHDSWGVLRTTQVIYDTLDLTGVSFEQGDYWLKDGDVLMFNGSTWASAGKSLMISGDGDNLNNGWLNIKGKTTSPYVKEVRIVVENIDEPYEIRVTQTSPDSSDSYFVDVTWESFQEVSAKVFHFPNLATAQVVAKATDQFSSIPDMSGIWDGRIVKIPTNYDPVARTYEGVWDGTFKIDYTNNPAWICYDLIDNDRYGLRAFYDVQVNIWDLYEAAQWCDTIVVGGRPRFTFNGLIADPRPGRETINYIAGLFGGRFIDDGNGFLTLKIDRDGDAEALFTAENVVDGMFRYSFTDVDSRTNDVTVSFINPALNWEEDRRRVFDQDSIDRYGRRTADYVAYGATNAPEAIARGRYKVITSVTETTMVSFKTNRQGLYLQPYSIILVADEDISTGISGRAKAVTGAKTFSLRDPVFIEPGHEYQVHLQTTTGVETLTLDEAVTGALTSLTTVEDLPANLPEKFVFTIESAETVGVPKAYRVVSISEDDNPDNVDVTAIEVNRLKWFYVDGEVDEIEDVEHINHSGGRPEPVPAIRITALTDSLVLDWDPSPTALATGYRLYASRNGGAVQLLVDTSSYSFELVDPKPGTWLFWIVAVSNGGTSQPRYLSHELMGEVRPIRPVTGLRMVNEPNPVVFESRSPEFTWQPSTDSFHSDYVIRVFDPDTEEELSEATTTATSLICELVPQRNLLVAVTDRDTFGFESPPTYVSVNNPAPAAPIGVSLAVNAGAVIVTVPPSAEQDVVGIVVYASTVSGFTPDTSSLKYKGTNQQVSLLLGTNQTVYVRVAHYDVFGDADLNIAAEQSIFVPSTSPYQNLVLSETSAILAAMTSTPRRSRVFLIDDVIGELIDAGLWSKLAMLYMMAAHHEQAARVGWKNPTSVMTAVNAPTFTVDRGFTGNGTSSHLDTGRALNTLSPYGQNDMTAGVWLRSAGSSNGYALGQISTVRLAIIPRNGTGSFLARANNAASTTVGAATTALGHTTISRNDPASLNGYRDGVLVANVAATSETPGAGVISLLRGASSYSNQEIAVAYAGAYLTASEIASLHTILNTYLTEVGAV